MAYAGDADAPIGAYGCNPGPSVYGMPCQMPPQWWQADVANGAAYAFWRDLLVQSAITAFTWRGLPGDIDGRFIELTFLFQGAGGFFQKIPGRIDFASGAQVGKPDMYLNPEVVNFVSVNGTGTWTRRIRPRTTINEETGAITFEDAEATWAYDNNLRIPLFWHIEQYAKRLARFDRVIDINAAAQTTPWVGEANEEARLDLANAIKQITGLEPAIATGPGFLSDTNVHVFNTQAPYVVDKLQDARKQELSVIYTMLGIDNDTTEKRERLISDEVDSNNEQVAILRQSRMDKRKKLAQETNDLFGTDISVSWSVAYDDDGAVDMGDDAKEGGEGYDV